MKYALIVLALILAVYLVVSFNGRIAELNRLKTEKEVVEARYQNLQQTKAALEAQIEYASSDAAVNKWARENHMARAGDIPVVPLQAVPITPTPQPTPIVKTTEISNLQAWIWLFSDSAP